MTWTYDADNFTGTNLELVRLELGDTNTKDQLLTDEIINVRLGQYSNDITNTVFKCIQDILSKIARDYDRSNVGMSATRSQQTQHYRDMLKEKLAERNQLAEGALMGVSRDEENTLAQDDDYKGSSFGKGMDDLAILDGMKSGRLPEGS